MAGRSPLGREQRRDLLVGLILLALGLAWTAIVFATIPPGNFGIGPRAFPLWLGIGLVILSAIMAASAWLRPAEVGELEPDLADRAWPLLTTTVTVALIIACYGWLMQGAGFVIATIVTVAFSLRVVLGVRRPLLVAGMALGLTAGSWLIFGQILGAYLPTGTWSLF